MVKPKGSATGATNSGKSSSMGNKGGAVRGKARAAQVQARNAARTNNASRKPTVTTRTISNGKSKVRRSTRKSY